MEKEANRIILPFESQQSWEAWLAEHYQDSPGIWLKIAKKDSGIPTVTYAEALDSALCYGWIDGQKDAFDNQYWLQKFTPRGAKSKWSQINRDKAEALIAARRMQPAGLRQIEQAKADGRWDAAYPAQSKMTVPEDFQSELDKNPAASEFFAALDRGNRFAILYRLHDAKKPETRAARIRKFIEMLEKKEKLYP